MNVPLGDQIKAAARELALRRNVYPGFVRKGRMKQEQADHEVAAMQAIVDLLRALSAWHEAEKAARAAVVDDNMEQLDKAVDAADDAREALFEAVG